MHSNWDYPLLPSSFLSLCTFLITAVPFQKIVLCTASLVMEFCHSKWNINLEQLLLSFHESWTYSIKVRMTNTGSLKISSYWPLSSRNLTASENKNWFRGKLAERQVEFRLGIRQIWRAYSIEEKCNKTVEWNHSAIHQRQRKWQCRWPGKLGKTIKKPKGYSDH